MAKKDIQKEFLNNLLEVKPNLEKFVLNLTRNREFAREVMAETISSAFENFRKIKDRKSFLSYIFTIAYRKYNRIKKANNRYSSIEKEDIEELFAYDHNFDLDHDVKLLYKALEQLPPEQSEAIILFDIHGFKQAEIAEIQNTTVNNIKVRIHRGKKQLSSIMKEENHAKSK